MDSIVSIIAPCYNGEKYIDRFIKSIMKQTYKKIELIIIDDGSEDNTEKIINSYRKKLELEGIKLIYRYQENAGQAAALNLGLKLFIGDYLLCLDSDDEISKEFIEKRVEFLKNNDEYVYCHGKVKNVFDDNKSENVCVYKKKEISGELPFFEDILYVRDVFFSGYMVETTAFEKVIPNREIYTGKGGQNAQILLPLAWYYGEPGYVEDSEYIYHIRSDSHSHSQNTSERIIEQLCNYEKILLETIDRIQDITVQKYKKKIIQHYARLKFGNAVDTKKVSIVKEYYQKLKCTTRVTFHERILYIKYTNPFIRKFLHIEEVK